MSIPVRILLSSAGRSPMHLSVAATVTLLACLLGATPTGAGQAAGINQGGPGYLHAQPGLDPVPQSGNSASASQIDRMRLNERQRHLVEDSARLLELASQLKTEIDHTPADQVSLDVVRKAAELEKLAHDLKGWTKS